MYMSNNMIYIHCMYMCVNKTYTIYNYVFTDRFRNIFTYKYKSCTRIVCITMSLNNTNISVAATVLNYIPISNHYTRTCSQLYLCMYM